jgi:RNA polymerase sigma factor (sigma-70 family)
MAKEKISDSKAQDMVYINQALSGEQSAYKNLMKKYSPYVKNLIFKMINQPDEVDDIMQDTFVKAFNALAKFDSQYAFSTWLLKIATNNCIDFIRKKKLQTFSIDKDIGDEDSDYKFEIPDSDFLPDKQIISLQREKILNEAIDSLPEKYKKVIIMRHKLEKDYDEIAKELKLPLGTVKAHIFRAREILNKFLKDKITHY